MGDKNEVVGKLLGGAIVAVGTVGVTFGGVIGIAAVMAYPTKWVFNYLVSPNTIFTLFGVYQLSLWKAMALNYISGSLFKSSSSCKCKKEEKEEKKEEKKVLPGTGRYVS